MKLNRCCVADDPLIASLDDEFSRLEKNVDKMKFPVRKKNSALLENFKRFFELQLASSDFDLTLARIVTWFESYTENRYLVSEF